MVNGNVTIQSGFKLTIMLDTTVKFNNGAGLSVFGTLFARGSSNDRITFTSNEADPNNKLARGDWDHIIFEDPSSNAIFDGSGNFLGGSIIQFAIIEFATDAIVARASPFIDSNIIRNNSGTAITADGDIRITNNTIVDNAGGGLSIAPGIVIISGNTIKNNTASLGGGLYLKCVCTINNNVITGNLATGVHGGGGINSKGGLSLFLNDIHDNRSGPGGGTLNDFTNRLPVGSPDVNAEDNWWGTTTPAVIEGSIWHFVDEPNKLGIVDYNPTLGAPVFPKLQLEARRLTPFRHV